MKRVLTLATFGLTLAAILFAAGLSAVPNAPARAAASTSCAVKFGQAFGTLTQGAIDCQAAKLKADGKAAGVSADADILAYGQAHGYQTVTLIGVKDGAATFSVNGGEHTLVVYYGDDGLVYSFGVIDP